MLRGLASVVLVLIAGGLIAGSLTAGCGSPSLKRAGEQCSASAECDKGLLCDLGQSPAVCSDHGSLDAPPPAADASPQTDARPADAKPIDAKPIDAKPIDAPDAM